MSDTVWDYEPSLGTPDHDPVSGKVHGSPGPSLDLGVFANLAIQLGGLCSRMDRQQADFERRAASIPGDYQNSTQGTFPSSGTLALDLGAPAKGQFWNVRRIVIGGADITTQPAGVGWVFVQGSPPNQSGSNPTVAQAADFTSGTLPQRAFYGTHQLVVGDSEHLWVVIAGGTAGTQYVASVKAETYLHSSQANYEE